MRRRLILHETAFTRRRFFTSHFIDVNTFYLFLNWFSRVSATTTKIHGPQFQRNYIVARDKKKWLTWLVFQSSPKINRMLIKRLLVYNESLQHLTIAVYSLLVLLIKILFFFRPLSTNVQRWPPDPYFAFSSLVPHFSEEWKCGKVWQTKDNVTLFHSARNLCHSLLSSTLLRGVEVWKSLNVRIMSHFSPGHETSVILYLVLHFSEVRKCGKVWP